MIVVATALLLLPTDRAREQLQQGSGEHAVLATLPLDEREITVNHSAAPARYELFHIVPVVSEAHI